MLHLQRCTPVEIYYDILEKKREANSPQPSIRSTEIPEVCIERQGRGSLTWNFEVVLINALVCIERESNLIDDFVGEDQQGHGGVGQGALTSWRSRCDFRAVATRVSARHTKYVLTVEILQRYLGAVCNAYVSVCTTMIKGAAFREMFSRLQSAA